MNEKFIRAACALLAAVFVISPAAALAIEAPFDETTITQPGLPDPSPVPVPTEPTDDPDPPDDDPDVPRPPVTANDFIPEERDLTSCIGVLERPGCGSEQRGGWRQTLTLGAIFLGLTIVFGNVIRGVRKRNG